MEKIVVLSVLPLLYLVYLQFIKDEQKMISAGVSCSMLSLGVVIYSIFYIQATSTNKYLFDGLTTVMLITTHLVMLLTFLSIKKVPSLKLYVSCLLIIEFLLNCTFITNNLLWFYVFFESTLIPLYIIIGLWGGENRIYASFKFFLYTLAGSVLLLAAIIYIYSHAGQVSITQLGSLKYIQSNWLWVCIFIAFAVKVPIFPLHTWLPDAHVQAPTQGSMVLAGILLKLGGYGLIRILIPLFPNPDFMLNKMVLILSACSIIYASCAAFVQTDIKKMIAYSSIAHMGYVTGGIFSGSTYGMQGAIFQMFSHGVISTGLFFLTGMLYERFHTKNIDKFGGIASFAPRLALFFMILTFGSIGLPGTSGFVGEFLSLYGIFANHHIIAVFCALGILLSAVYMLKLYRKIMLGDRNSSGDSDNAVIKDVNHQELLVLAITCCIVILIGIFPQIIFTILDKSI
jgi:NADH-quinone oxidoreductase subunit M